MLLAAFRLAFHFRRPLSELNIPLSEFWAWLAYLRMEPPDQGDDYRAAAIMSQITNMSGRSLPGQKHVSPDDFLRKKPKRQTAEEQKDFFRSLTRKPDGS